MIHEEAAKQQHPDAVDFLPVRNFFRSVVGWTFEIPRENEASPDYGWVTIDGEASSDKLPNRFSAERSLKSYCQVVRNNRKNSPEEYK